MGFKDPESKVQRAAVFSVRNLRPEDATRLLESAVDEKDLSVAKAVIEVAVAKLLWSSSPFVENMLSVSCHRSELLLHIIYLLRESADQSPLVRSEAAGALGALRDPRALEPLTKALADRAWLVRYAAEEALSHLKSRHPADR